MTVSMSLESYQSGSTSWARAVPAGFAQFASYGKWHLSDHLLLIQWYLLHLIGDDNDNDNLIISMPPRHGKSMFVSQYFPAWYLGTYPNKEVIITSYEASLASIFGGRVRDLIATFGPDLWEGLAVQSYKRAASDWRLDGRDAQGIPVTGGLRAAGVGSGLTGRGGDLILIDDPFKDAQQANSETYRNRVWDWYMSTLFTRREPGAKQVVIMTRWHEDDLVGRLIDRQEEQEGVQWSVLSLPAIAETSGDSGKDILSREEGEPLWPDRWPLEKLEEIQSTMSPYWWASLYQQRPAPIAGNVIKRAWWRFWHPADVELPPVRLQGVDEPIYSVPLPTMTFNAQSWDLAFKKGHGTSFVVGQAWGMSSDSSAYLLDQTRDRRDFPETLEAFRSFSDAHPYPAKWVEEAANGAALVSVLTDEIPGIIPVRVEGSKEDRARAASHYIEAGNVYLPHPAIAPWVIGYIDELSSFPNAKNNDQVDTTSQALRKLFAHDDRPALLWGSHHRRS